jgi:hypothetical protein
MYQYKWLYKDNQLQLATAQIPKITNIHTELNYFHYLQKVSCLKVFIGFVKAKMQFALLELRDRTRKISDLQIAKKKIHVTKSRIR